MSDKIVMVNGCFDLFHYGHLHFLEQAATYGDYLVVGLNADSTILGRKGRCIRTVDERKAILEALKCVKEVQVFKEPTAVMLMEAIQPHVYVTGDEYRGRSPECALALQMGIGLGFVHRVGNWSTTNEIRRAVA